MRFKPHGPQKPQRAQCGPVWRITSSHKSHTLGVWLMWSECACGHWASCSWERKKNSAGGAPAMLGCFWRASPGLQPLVMDRSGDGGSPIPILLFGQLILELYRAHRLALVVQKLAVERRLPLDSIELAGAACNCIHAIQCSRC